MATIEFIQKRIDGKEKEIEKLNKKIARIEAAKATNWEKNPYWYSERDLVSATRDRDAAQNSLENYKRQLVEAQDKKASRNIPAIIEFLDRWEATVIEYFLQEREKFLVAQKEYYAKDSELCNQFNSSISKDWQERKAIQNEMRKLSKEFRDAWTHITQFDHGGDNWETTMRKDISKEKDAKYDDLLDRVISITGPITDASCLRIGAKGDLNGIVKGEKGDADVKTIGAGGYNIQCYHYRTLIHPI